MIGELSLVVSFILVVFALIVNYWTYKKCKELSDETKEQLLKEIKE